MTRDRRTRLGPLGRRLLTAFVLVALTSIVVLTLAALIGTARGLTAGEDVVRQGAASATAEAASEAYRRAEGWQGADLAPAFAVAAANGAEAAISDGSGGLIASSASGGMGMGGMGRGGVNADVMVDGEVVGSVRLGFGSPASSRGQSIAWTWILIAAVVALLTAFVVAWYVTRWITRPLTRISEVARCFASGDRSARASAEDREAAGELGDLARAFDSAAVDVQRSETARRRLSADVAHELRTPLAALQAGLEELRDGLVEPDAARMAALHDQSLRLGRIVDDLSQLSAAETATFSMRRELVDLGAVVEITVAGARPALEAAGLALTADLDRDVMVEGDEDRLHQVMANLLGNAARYCRPGDSVRVAVSRDADTAVLEVSDTGPGISAEDRPHVFERMWRGSGSEDVAGSGIGLAVVRELVQAHAGTIEATSDGHSGTTFSVRLPVAGVTLAGA